MSTLRVNVSSSRRSLNLTVCWWTWFHSFSNSIIQLFLKFIIQRFSYITASMSINLIPLPLPPLLRSSSLRIEVQSTKDMFMYRISIDYGVICRCRSKFPPLYRTIQVPFRTCLLLTSCWSTTSAVICELESMNMNRRIYLDNQGRIFGSPRDRAPAEVCLLTQQKFSVKIFKNACTIARRSSPRSQLVPLLP